MIQVYYNEWEPYAAGWLRNLIGAGLIPPGDVDERSIIDVRADDLRGYDQCHFFCGIAGWPLALKLAGYSDARSLWTGSCPCQPFSAAGKGTAADDDRHLWPQWFSLIRERRPAIVFGEQVEAAIGWGWLDSVFSDLEEEGYACGASVLPACSVGAPHLRQRLFFVAQGAMEHAAGEQVGIPGRAWEQGSAATAIATRCNPWVDLEWLFCIDGKWRPTQPGLFPLAYGVPARVGRLRAYGNAISPQVAAEFIRAAM